jgi:carbon starvation protein
MDKLVGYWYHYAVMFEALFILTTVDAGTRSARYILQDMLGKGYKPFSNPKWIPGIVMSTAIVVGSWGYLIYTGSISTIWPLFGAGNQLLATIALAIGTVYLVNDGKLKYAWVTAVPMVFVGVTTLVAAVLSITNIFLPLAHTPGTELQGSLDAILMSLCIVGVVLVVAAAFRRCWQTLHGAPLPVDSFGAVESGGDQVKIGCC